MQYFDFGDISFHIYLLISNISYNLHKRKQTATIILLFSAILTQHLFFNMQYFSLHMSREKNAADFLSK